MQLAVLAGQIADLRIQVCPFDLEYFCQVTGRQTQRLGVIRGDEFRQAVEERQGHDRGDSGRSARGEHRAGDCPHGQRLDGGAMKLLGVIPSTAEPTSAPAAAGLHVVGGNRHIDQLRRGASGHPHAAAFSGAATTTLAAIAAIAIISVMGGRPTGAALTTVAAKARYGDIVQGRGILNLRRAARDGDRAALGVASAASVASSAASTAVGVNGS